MSKLTVIPLSPFANTPFGKYCAWTHDMPELEFQLLAYGTIAIIGLAAIGLRSVIVALWIWYKEMRHKP